jgi:hypothetical protein
MVGRAGYKLAAGTASTVATAAGVAAAGAVLAVAVGISAVPAVTCGPLALVCEPVCRAMGYQKNPLATAAVSGVFVSGALVFTCASCLPGFYDSD